MLFSPLAYIGLEGALHKSLLKLLIFPFKGLSGMGGKGRGWGQDGSNRSYPPPRQEHGGRDGRPVVRGPQRPEGRPLFDRAAQGTRQDVLDS